MTFCGFALIFGGLLAVKYWVFNLWFLSIPIGGLAIFIPGTMKFIKNLDYEKD
jgi:hypothetical protein